MFRVNRAELACSGGSSVEPKTRVGLEVTAGADMVCLDCSEGYAVITASEGDSARPRTEPVFEVTEASLTCSEGISAT